MHVYGYGLTMTTSGGSLGYGQVAGLWGDCSAFSIDLDTAETHSHVSLHEIPEPATLAVVALGGFMALRRRAGTLSRKDGLR